MPDGNSQLSAMLNNEETEVPAEAVVEETEVVEEALPVEAETPARDEKGRFAAKEETPSELPREEYKAIREEREKRQTLERELEALKQQFQQSQQPQEPPAPPPSMWEDEQGYTGHVISQAGQVGGFEGKLWASEFDAMRAHPDDFPEMKERFIKLAAENPTVADRALKAAHPWEEAYKIAKKAATLESLDAVDLPSLEAKLREQIMAELQQGQSPVPQPLNVPPTLTGERNVGARTGPAWGGPPTLSEMLR